MENLQKISVVIPFYNEEDNIPAVLEEAVDVLRRQGCAFEIIAVDDGSGDQTPELLKSFTGRIPELRIITHPRNRGQGAAFFSGFQAAQGEVLVTIDGDGQNDFHDVPVMLKLLPRHDAVFGQRSRRDDPVQKLIASRIAFFFRRLVLGDQIRDTACGLKVMKKETLKALVPIRGFYRFIPFLLALAGYSCAAIDVNHRPRRAGKTKYSLLKGYFLPTIADLLFMWWYRKNYILLDLRRRDINHAD